MLNEALLLDSTRPVSEKPHNVSGCPEITFTGVPSSCLESPEQSYSWYVLRVSYSRELKIKELLDQMGIRVFVPMMWRTRTIAGKTEKRLVPAVNNLCFVLWDRVGIDSFIRGFGDVSPVHYYWDRTANNPMTVPKQAMDDFIKVASTMDEDLIYITEINSKLREGQTVKVTSGSFAGVTGKIVRRRKSRRIMVELPGMLAVATTYVKPENVEIVTV